MTLPVPTSQLLDYMPHRPPMVWVDQVTAIEPAGGSATVRLQANGLYMSADGVRPSSFIEFLAQAFGFIGICRHIIYPVVGGSAFLEKAFLVAIRNAECLVEPLHPSLQPGELLTMTMTGKKDIGPIQLTDGQVLSATGELLAKAHLKVYAEYK